MAIGSGQVECTDTATAIISNDVDGQYVVIKNIDSSNAVFLGDTDVTITTGHKLKVGEEISLSLGPGEEIYGVCTEAAESVRVSYIATMNE